MESIVDVLDVVPVVEDVVHFLFREASRGVRVRLDQSGKIMSLVPAGSGVALHHFVGILSGHSFVHQRQKHPLAEHQATAALNIGPHPVREHPEVFHDPGENAQDVVQGQAGVREDDALGRGVADVSLSPKGDVFQSGDAMTTNQPGQPADAFGKLRVALVRHRR